jgi:uncharacterized RDD family membrane protein YckC
MAYAGFWIRFWAFFLDQIILLIVFVPAVFVLDEKFFNFASVAASFLYETLFISSGWQATPGKRLFSIRVVTSESKQLTFGHAAGRYLAKCVSGFLLGLGYVMVAFSQRKQGLHDRWADTVVIFTDRQAGLSEPPRARSIDAPKDMGGWVFAGFDSGGHVIKFRVSTSQLLASPTGVQVGRNVGSSGLQISDESVSRSHAILKIDGPHLTITDLGSTNGTFIGKTRVSPGVAVVVTGDQEVSFGSTTFSVGRE